MTLLATCYALHFTGRGMMQLYEANQKKMSQDAGKSNAKRGAGPEEVTPGSDLLADLHAAVERREEEAIRKVAAEVEDLVFYLEDE